jgi:hypothetical protein
MSRHSFATPDIIQNVTLARTVDMHLRSILELPCNWVLRYDIIIFFTHVETRVRMLQLLSITDLRLQDQAVSYALLASLAICMNKSPPTARNPKGQKGEPLAQRGNRYFRIALQLWSRLDPFSGSQAAKVSAIYTGWSLLFAAIFVRDVRLAERVSEMLDVLITHFPQISPMRYKRETIGSSGLWFRFKTSEEPDDRGILYGYGSHPITGEPIVLPEVSKNPDGTQVLENWASESWTWPTTGNRFPLGNGVMT